MVRLRRSPIATSDRTRRGLTRCVRAGADVSAHSRTRPDPGRATIRPPSSSTTRLRIWSTIAASCVAITTVVPVRLIRSRSFMIPTAGRGVEVPRRLVGQEDHRPVDECPGDRDALLLPAGELVGHPVVLAVEADQVEHLGHDPLDMAARLADDLEGERDVLAHRLVGQQPEVLEHGPDLAAERRGLPVGQPREILAGDVQQTLSPVAPRAGPGAASSTCPTRTARPGRRTRPVSTSTVSSRTAGRCWLAYCLETLSNRITTGFLGIGDSAGRSTAQATTSVRRSDRAIPGRCDPGGRRRDHACWRRQRIPASTKSSMSPSSTAPVLPVSTSVRRSLTIWYGCST